MLLAAVSLSPPAPGRFTVKCMGPRGHLSVAKIHFLELIEVKNKMKTQCLKSCIPAPSPVHAEKRQHVTSAWLASRGSWVLSIR